RKPARPHRERRLHAHTGQRRTQAPVHCRRGQTTALAPLHAGRKRIPVSLRHPRVVAIPSGKSLRSARQRKRTPRGLSAGRIENQPVRRKFELAGPHLVSSELPSRRIAAEIPSLLRTGLPSGISDRQRTKNDSGGSRGRNLQASERNLSSGRVRAPTRRRRTQTLPVRSVLEGSCAVPRVFPRRYRCRSRRKSSDWMDGTGRKTPDAKWRSRIGGRPDRGESCYFVTASFSPTLVEKFKVRLETDVQVQPACRAVFREHSD